MADLTAANMTYSEGRVFWYEDLDHHFYIDAVVPKQPYEVLFCLYFDMAKQTALTDQDPKRFSSNTITKALWDGRAQFIDPHNMPQEQFSPTGKQQKRIDMWLKFMEILQRDNDQQLPRAIDPVRKAIEEMNWADYDYQVPGLSNCQEKIRQYDNALKESKNATKALCPHGSHAMEGASRLAPATEDLILCHLDDKYLVDMPAQKVNPAEIYREFCDEFEGLQRQYPELYPSLPCQETFYKRIRALDKVVVALKRLDDSEKAKLRRLRKTTFIVDRVLQRVEFDAVHIAMGIIKYEGTGKKRKRVYRGRIVLMFAIDVFSRAIIGYSYHIAKKPGENADLAVQCFKSMLMPKNSDLDWPVYGKPSMVVSDGSTAATGNQFHEIVTSTGAIHTTTPSNQPWKKPFIERFMLTLRTQFLSKFDTYLGSKLYRKHDHLNNDESVEKVVMNPKKKHCMTEEKFVRDLERYISEHYNKDTHEGLNRHSPLEVWKQSVSQDGMHWTRLPSEHPVFTRLGLKAGMRKIYQDGVVRAENGFYSSPYLKEISGKLDEIEIFYSDIDSTHVAFEHNGSWHSASLCPANYTPTDTSQRAALDHARDNQHGPKPKKRRRSTFKPSVTKSFQGQSSSSGNSSDTRGTEQTSIPLDSEDASRLLKQAEAEILANAPAPYVPSLDETAQSDTDEFESNVQVSETSRKRIIGEKL